MSQPEDAPAQHSAEHPAADHPAAEHPDDHLLAARLLDQATDDRSLRTRLRASYPGRHDVLDALWWRAHPLSTAPSGTPDPALELEPLRRAAYARSTAAPVRYTDTATGMSALVAPAELALRQAMGALEADAAALDRVLALDHDDRKPVAASVPPPGPLRRRLGLTVAAVVVVAAVAFSLGRLTDRPATSAASAPSGSSRSEYSGAGQRGAATLALLESAQQPHDIPPFALGTDTIASSVHLIFDGFAPGITVYGALGHRDSVCMVVIVAENESAQTCSPADRFIDDGLRLRVTTRERVVNDSGYLVPSYVEFSWAGDGSVGATSNASPSPVSPGL